MPRSRRSRNGPAADLEELALANSKMGNTAAMHVAANLKQLKRLYFDNSDIGDVGVAELAKMPNLQLLTLNGTRVTDAGLTSLTKLATLEELQLSFDITDKTRHHRAVQEPQEAQPVQHEGHGEGLQELGKLPQLKEIELRGSGISNEAISAFMKAHPNVSVKQ